MSVFSGPQYKGAMRDHKQRLRIEAAERDAYKEKWYRDNGQWPLRLTSLLGKQ